MRKVSVGLYSRAISIALAGVSLAGQAHAQQDDPLLIHEEDGTEIRATLNGGINLVYERNLYWNLADIFAPSANFESDTEWAEFYIKPGVNLTQKAGETGELYARLSGVASATVGTDGFAQGDTGRVTLEEAYIGFATGAKESGRFDVSIGAREFKLGTGMLIANGASNGFERGAVKLGPRKAWERAAIARFTRGNLSLQAFYLDPNELDSNDSGTKIAGGDVRADWGSGDFAGASYINVLESGAPYPQASPGGSGPPVFLDGGRDGLNALSFYSQVHPLREKLPGFYVALDGAYEWNGRIDLDAWAGRITVGHLWAKSKWRPELFYSYKTFSGDDPETSTLERFDPLNYEGSPASWATGSKSALVFINSNVQSHQLTLKLMPSPKDFLTFRTAHIRVNELRSPVQFGQATRLEIADGLGSVVAGVTHPHLADDFFIEYTRLLNRNMFLTGGFSISTPGKGIERAIGDDAPAWTGGFVNLVFQY